MPGARDFSWPRGHGPAVAAGMGLHSSPSGEQGEAGTRLRVRWCRPRGEKKEGPRSQGWRFRRERDRGSGVQLCDHGGVGFID